MPATNRRVDVGVKSRALDFLATYGEKGYAVLRAAVKAYLSREGREVGLGHFSFREVAARLKAWGLNYNPSMLLRIMERDYGLIETTYRSGTQHWWNFVDFDAVVEALSEYETGSLLEDDYYLEEPEDPEAELLRLQIASLNPRALIEELRRLKAKTKLSRYDLARLRTIAFNELELAVRLLRKAEEIGYEGEEVQLLKSVIALAAQLSRKLLKVAELEAESRADVARIAAQAPLDTGRQRAE
ncbi:MAG: hypothetical protein ABWW70_04370 [Thermoproteota archaeon]